VGVAIPPKLNIAVPKKGWLNDAPLWNGMEQNWRGCDLPQDQKPAKSSSKNPEYVRSIC